MKEEPGIIVGLLMVTVLIHIHVSSISEKIFLLFFILLSNIIIDVLFQDHVKLKS